MSKLHVIWDLDGTLINSRDEVLASLVKSVGEAGLSEKQQVAPLRVGPTVDKMLDLAFTKDVLTPDIKERVIKNFRTNYDNCGFTHTLPFDGVTAILQDNRFVHHIITNKPDLPTKRIVEKLGWNIFFDSIITPYSFMKSPDDKKKSKTELFSFLVQQYPHDTFVGIGDMATDAKAAIDNKIVAIGVLWGEGTKQELTDASCTVICSTMLEMLSALEQCL
ncbi:MAG: HAD hydrolase-like protein [Treponema sp.]|nr:HAD hydrolase-like protein [Treponema sp.]